MIFVLFYSLICPLCHHANNSISTIGYLFMRCVTNVRVVYIDFRANFVNFLRFRYTAKISFIAIQLRVIKELFHQSSFYLKNIVTNTFLRGRSPGELYGGKCPRPVSLMEIVRSLNRSWIYDAYFSLYLSMVFI